MADQKFKRNTAYKLRIGDILVGKPIFDNEKYLYMELGEKKISRVNVIGNIVDKYESDGERKYLFLTLDDGSGQIKLKVFGEEELVKFKGVMQGQTVTIIGTVRNWNNETYVQPEIIKEQDPKYLLIRKLELEKERKDSAPKIEDKQEIKAIKDQVLDKIRDAENEGGIDQDKIIMDLRETSPDIINQEIKKLLEEGIVFEPRPGRLRYLG
ncbi:MAG: OB-fold nucleic acid binding domain-containing protein [Nanoarchaeota archaeon]|nr:OB-fold nucleic acid binding domain-containing protein [Nanoarchaeota archaeon]